LVSTTPEPREFAYRRRKNVATVIGMYALLGAAAILLHEWVLPPVRPQFYEIAAQVIPVLLLVAAIERRVFEQRPGVDRTANSIRVWLAAGFFSGEVSALYAAATGYDEAWIFAGATVALTTGLMLVFALGMSQATADNLLVDRAASDVGALVVAIENGHAVEPGPAPSRSSSLAP
jgi:peptidoglycan/LPS O-acetylase OafA/YrhL